MTQVSRRSFIKNTGVAGFALWLGISSDGYAGIGAPGAVKAKNFAPFILVESNGTITLFASKPEMGQGTFQAIPALMAEELEVSLDKVIIKLTNGEKEFGPQHAGGSSSVRTTYNDFRKVGAAAREVFVQAAANKWQVDLDACYVEEATVIHRPTRRTFTYGQLVEDAAKLKLPKEPKLKDPKDFKILGKAMKRPDVLLKTNGAAEFGIDVRLPDMLYASV